MNKEIEELRQQLEQKKEELRKLELSCLDVCQENTALEKKLAQAQLQLKHQWYKQPGWLSPDEAKGLEAQCAAMRAFCRAVAEAFDRVKGIYKE